jgi:hypothetical protein
MQWLTDNDYKVEPALLPNWIGVVAWIPVISDKLAKLKK